MKHTRRPSTVTLGLWNNGAALSALASVNWQRWQIVRRRLFDWSQLLSAAALGSQVIGLLAVDPVYRSVVTMPGVGVLLLGLVLITRAQRPPRARQG
ncbi:hypothetical protein ACN6AT_06875 [Streptomyces sp. JL4002]|uniref:hypothetical protein n=1 Tax=Streptomyces sp. JL4002 TaxID=3404781 RepID=UPI003B28511F